MATATQTYGEWRGVRLSRRHDGQTCRPNVESRRRGSQVDVRYHWVDGSIVSGGAGREYAHGTATGTYWDVVRTLEAAGIHIDDL